MISYKQDPLFENRNIYSCLVKKTDLQYKNTFGLRTPNIEIINKKRIIKLTKEKYRNLNKGFLHFIKELEDYLGIKYISIYKTKYKYLQLFKKNKANIIFLRVISLSLTNNIKESNKLFEKFIIKNNYIKINNLKLPISNFNKTIIYLTGVIAGDGHLDKRETELIIADGQSNKEKLLMSKEFLESIHNLFKREFNVNGRIDNHKTWLTYRLGNKWLCRFFNHYFEIPFGEKSNIIKFPKTISDSNEKYFWRGLMDTDGYVREHLKQISAKSNSLVLINQFKDFCKRNNIHTNINKEKRAYALRIFTDSFLNYAKLIGFSHPRKKEILKKHLGEGPKYKILKQNNKNNYLFKFLKPYKNNVYISFSEHNQKTNKNTVKKLLNEIFKTFNVKITKIKRNRYNNHYYICSKKFTEFVRNNTIYELPWQPLNKSEINNISKEWIL